MAESITSRAVQNNPLGTNGIGFQVLPYESILSTPQIAGSMIWDEMENLAYISCGVKWRTFFTGIDALFLRGREIDSTAPSDGDAYVWDAVDEMWKPENVVNGNNLQGIPVEQIAPVDCDVLQYDLADNEWKITMLPNMATFTNCRVYMRIRGNTVNSFVNDWPNQFLAQDLNGVADYTFTGVEQDGPDATPPGDSGRLRWFDTSTPGAGNGFAFVKGTVQARLAITANETFRINLTNIVGYSTLIDVQLGAIGVDVPFQGFILGQVIFNSDPFTGEAIRINHAMVGAGIGPSVTGIRYTNLDILFLRLN